MEPVRYNLGCMKGDPGDRPGFLTVDLNTADIELDLRNEWDVLYKKPAVELLASHILEHMPLDSGIEFINKCYKSLLPGGKITIAVPDMDKFINCKINNNWDPVAGYMWTDLNWFMGGDEREANLHMRHYHMYSEGSLSWYLQQAGFVNIRRADFNELHNPAHRAISLYMEANKPE